MVMGARARIVIADDDLLTVTTTRMLLERLGYDVVGVATDGVAAVELGRSLRPDVILMDVQMPVLDGVEATRTLMREQPACVILISGRECLTDLAEQAGAMGCASKPLWADQLPALIETAQERFRRFLRLAAQAAGPEEALRKWAPLHRAVLAQSAALHITEEQAFQQLWRQPARRVVAPPRVRTARRPTARHRPGPTRTPAGNGV
jgi:AmiR/NasT family two-component response regulator